MDTENQSVRTDINDASSTDEASPALTLTTDKAEARRLSQRMRSRRKRDVAGRTFDRYSKRELALAKLENADLDHIRRPTTRGECAAVERPCPFVSCAHH